MDNLTVKEAQRRKFQLMLDRMEEQGLVSDSILFQHRIGKRTPKYVGVTKRLYKPFMPIAQDPQPPQKLRPLKVTAVQVREQIQQAIAEQNRIISQLPEVSKDILTQFEQAAHKSKQYYHSTQQPQLFNNSTYKSLLQMVYQFFQQCNPKGVHRLSTSIQIHMMIGIVKLLVLLASMFDCIATVHCGISMVYGWYLEVQKKVDLQWAEETKKKLDSEPVRQVFGVRRPSSVRVRQNQEMYVSHPNVWFVEDTGDFRPDRYGEMKWRNDLVLAKDANQHHPNQSTDYLYGGPILESQTINRDLAAAKVHDFSKVSQSIVVDRTTHVDQVLSLKSKLAADGVILRSQDACEKAFNVYEQDRDLTYRITNKKYPSPRLCLMHNPFRK